MSKRIQELVNQCKEDCLKGRDQDKKIIVELLDVDPLSEDALVIRAAANELTHRAMHDRGRVSFSVGVDYVPCRGNCRFCSFGEKWGVVNKDNAYVLSREQVVDIWKKRFSQGATSITLRTTEFYPHDELVELVRAVREAVPGDYNVGVNTGELSYQDCIDFYEAGANSAAHMLRLREGEDTCIDPEVRLRTIENIKASPLRWGACLDPIGPEHTHEEIADLLLTYHALGNPTCGTMKRSNVVGTPLGASGKEGELTKEQCLLYMAALRICSGKALAGSCHPSYEEALYSGACGMGVEYGAVPRTDGFVEDGWPNDDIPRAIALVEKAGFTVTRIIPPYEADYSDRR